MRGEWIKVGLLIVKMWKLWKNKKKKTDTEM